MGIIDLLKSSSGSSPHTLRPDPNLILTQHSTGTAVTGGLWSIKLTTTDDVEAIMSKVYSDGLNVNPNHTTVATLTLSTRSLAPSSVSKSAVRANKASATEASITFVALNSLENASHANPLHSFLTTLSTPYSNTGDKETALTQSRVGLLLTDGLLGRQALEVVTVLNPELEGVQAGGRLLSFFDSLAGFISDAAANDDSNNDTIQDESFYSQVNESRVMDADELALSPSQQRIRSPPKRVPANTSTNTPTSIVEAAVPKTLFKALEIKQEENIALQCKLDNMDKLLQELRFENDEYKTKFIDSGGTLNNNDKKKLANALRQVRDYEVYKNVMESTFVKMKDDIENLVKDRDGYKKRMERAEAFFRKEKGERGKVERKLRQVEEGLVEKGIELKSVGDSFGALEGEYDKLMKAHKAALKELGRMKVAVSERDDELKAAKSRISRMIVNHQKDKEEKKEAGEAEERVMQMSTVPPKKVFERRGVEERLSRAQGSLEAARRIMYEGK
jgi:hypothetical protein